MSETDPNAPINLGRLDDMRTMLEDDFGEFIEAYLISLNDILGQLGPATEPGKEKDLERLAHSLKSASLNAGADRLASLCSELELLLRRGEATPAGHVDRIRTEAVRAREALAQIS